MAKRRTKELERRAAKKAAKVAGLKPKGESKYARKKKGQYEPKIDPERRPSWFVRSGLAARAERALANDSISIAA